MCCSLFSFSHPLLEAATESPRQIYLMLCSLTYQIERGGIVKVDRCVRDAQVPLTSRDILLVFFPAMYKHSMGGGQKKVFVCSGDSDICLFHFISDQN